MDTLESVQNLVTDVCRDNYKNILVKQNDLKSRCIIVRCTENGEFKFLNNQTMKCNIKVLTPDKRHIYNTCAIQDDGMVMVMLTKSILCASGVAKAELNIIGMDDSSLIATMNFNIIIKPSVFGDDEIIGSDEFNVLVDLIAKEKERIQAVIELENLVTENESERNANEETRKTNENSRINAELERKNAESERVSAENTRKENEITRKNNENTRIGNEQSREEAEAERELNETARISSEETRVQNENNRQESENERVENESSRTSAETQRNLKESERNTAEEQRISNENERMSNELARKKNESDRIANETARVNSENKRQIDCETAITNANTAADRANSAAEACESIADGNVVQNTFTTVSAGGTSITASSPSDTLNIVAGDNVSVDANSETNEITISSDKYTHPSGSGNNHIPSGGSSGKILEWESSGTAKWADKPSQTRVKGNNESSYRTGDVNVTPEDIGALYDGIVKSDSNPITINGVGIYNNVFNLKGELANLGTFMSNVVSVQGIMATNGYLKIIDSSGYYNGIYASQFSTQSSRRVKTNIIPMTEDEARKILDVGVVGYDYINGAKDQYGMIAEDVHKVIPNIVSGNVDCNDDDVESVMNIGIDYSKAVPYLIKMVQMMEQNDRKKDERMEMMEGEIREKEEKIERLKSELDLIKSKLIN